MGAGHEAAGLYIMIDQETENPPLSAPCELPPPLSAPSDPPLPLSAPCEPPPPLSVCSQRVTPFTVCSHLLQPSLPPAGDQAFKHMSLGVTFHIQPMSGSNEN